MQRVDNSALSKTVLSTAVAPCKIYSRSLRLTSWNVEGLREVGKYDQLFAFMKQRSTHILAMQETHSQSSQEFSKPGFLVLHSSAQDAPRHGVGFTIAPALRPYVHSFLPQGPRVCSIHVNTSPKPLQVLCVYAPSLTQEAATDKARKLEFRSQFSDFLAATVEAPDNLVVLGDFNARLDEALDVSGEHIGPHVWGKRMSIDSADRDNAVYLLETMQNYELKLPQTFISLPPAHRVTYKGTTCVDHLLQNPQAHDWTAFDFVLTSVHLAFDIQTIRSYFQQAVS